MELGINAHNGAHLSECVFTPVLHGFPDTIRTGKSSHTACGHLAVRLTRRANTVRARSRSTLKSVGDPAATAPAGPLTVTRVRELADAVVATRQPRDPNPNYVDGLQPLRHANAGHLHNDLHHPQTEGHNTIVHRFTALTSWQMYDSDD